MNKDIIEFLKSKGRTVEQPKNIDEQVNKWKSWYKGEVSGFHKYEMYQGKKKVPQSRKSLKMASTICEDWADNLLNEKVQVNCNNETVGLLVRQLLSKSNFYVKGNQLIERSFALGGGFFVEYWDGRKPSIKYVTQEHMIPLTFTSGRLIEAAFTSTQTIDGKLYEYLEVHTLNNNGNYVVDNYLLEHRGKKLQEVNSEFLKIHKVEPKVFYNSATPKFQSIMPNVARKDSPDTPYGVSVFENAIDVLKSIDNEYDSFDNEFTLGRKRIFVSDGVAQFQTNEQGEIVPVFDPTDTAFYRLPEDNRGDNIPITESNMSLRVNEHNEALQTQLNLLSRKCGFGDNHYRWNSGTVTTATQVISENSDMFRTLKKHELLLNDSICTMSKALAELYFQYNNLTMPNDVTFTVDFDDSIIEDTAEIKRQALTDYSAGLISQQEYYRQVYKLDDEQAKTFMLKMKEEQAEELGQSPIETEPQAE